MRKLLVSSLIVQVALLAACGGDVVVDAPAGGTSRVPGASAGTGSFVGWPETELPRALDDFGAMKSGIEVSWSIASTEPPLTGYFYADSEGTDIAAVPSGPIGSITDASLLTPSGTYFVGPLGIGGIAVLHEIDRDQYAALRFDAIQPAPPTADVTWFVLPPGEVDFSGYE